MHIRLERKDGGRGEKICKHITLTMFYQDKSRGVIDITEDTDVFIRTRETCELVGISSIGDGMSLDVDVTDGIFRLTLGVILVILIITFSILIAL